MPKKTEIDHYSDKEALDFHIKGKSGKIEINSSKPLTTKRDLSLAYSPGVAAPVKEIANNPLEMGARSCLCCCRHFVDRHGWWTPAQLDPGA